MKTMAKVALAAVMGVALAAWLMKPYSPAHKAGECLVMEVPSPNDPAQKMPVLVILESVDEAAKDYTGMLYINFMIPSPFAKAPAALVDGDLKKFGAKHVNCDDGAELPDPH